MIFKNIKYLDENFDVQENKFIQTKDEKIVYIGDEMPECDISKEEIYDGKGKFLMNGFFNCHCHVPMVVMRGYGEGLPLQDWLFTKIFPFEAKLTPEDMYWCAKLGAMELLSSGCCSISDMYYHLSKIAKALDECGLKANLSNSIISFDVNEDLSQNRGYTEPLEMLDLIRKGTFKSENDKNLPDQEGSRIKIDCAIHAEYTNHDKSASLIAKLSKENNMILQAHLSETDHEQEESKKRNGGMTPAQFMEKNGVFDNPTLFAHCVYISSEDEDLLKKNGAFLCHNPSSNLKLGSGIAPVKRWVEKGLNVVIGTDGASSNNNLDMMEEIHLAALLCRGVSKDANAVSAREILKMATINGAMAQGRKDCGQVKVGNRADLIVFDLMTPNMQPDFDTVANIVFSAQSSNIVLNMVDGKVVYKDGNFPFINKEEVFDHVNAILKRITGELESKK